MKEIISKISVTTFLLAYLFFCGTLYLISYWSTFNFDITNYIEFLDIPKSFVFPLATGIGVSILSILFQAIIGSLEKIKRDEKINKKLLPKVKELPIKILFFRIINHYNFWIGIILLICLIFYKPRLEWVVVTTSLTLIVFGISNFISYSVIIELFPHLRTRIAIAILLFFIPIFSFMTGKLNATLIWKNKKYHIVTNINFEDTLYNKKNLACNKLLGKLGHNLFLSDSLNSKIIILNLDKIQTIEYKFISKLAKE